jgi:hypothetical protein
MHSSLQTFFKLKEKTVSRKTYSVGDTIILKAGLTRTATADRLCKIVNVLPADHGEIQYRVRFGAENFERRIVHGDIDHSETTLPVHEDKAAPKLKNESWLKPASLKIGK